MLIVQNFQDGDVCVVYKNVVFDVWIYKKLKMFIYGEGLIEYGLNLQDLMVFICFGIDFVDNYYEYEFLLNVILWGIMIDFDIWLESNDMEIVFDDFIKLKMCWNDFVG